MKAIALFVVAWMLVGCNAMEGLGKDIKKGGESLEKAATK